MSYDKNNKGSIAIVIAASVIALALVTTASFNHSYTVFAVSKKSSDGTKGVTTLGGVSSSPTSSSTSTGIPSPNTLTKKQLSSFVSCINTANKAVQGLTHKVVTNCLDIAKGTILTSTTSSAASSSTGKSKSLSSLILPS
jgi:hypothetical protein